ncbi:MAG: hypothetical protein Tsb002_05740 [Wenzhouxiangellaceae bacterium]
MMRLRILAIQFRIGAVLLDHKNIDPGSSDDIEVVELELLKMPPAPGQLRLIDCIGG